MIEWDKISDEEMRQAVVDDLCRKREDYLRQAGRNDERATNQRETYRCRRDAEACARYSRRQAAHYQQAIDLLTKAEMPETNTASDINKVSS